MKVNLTGAFEYMDVNVGFGNAAWHIYRELKKQGINVVCKDLQDDTFQQADVEICFDQPHRYTFVCPNAYRIGYTPWESTAIPSSWNAPLTSCNEIWTPNNFGREVFTHLFPNKPVFVYQHGISAHYKPKKRKIRPNRPFTFLFIGEPQWRKDGQMATEVFLELFANNPDYQLIIKATKISNIDVQDENGQAHGTPESLYSNVIVMRDLLSPAQLLALYEEADVFIYPSWGEGWGFNPIQAMAMGIPTISTHVWADYAEYITVPIDSYLGQTPWPELHPGQMFKPDRSQFKSAMATARENYETLSSIAFKNSFKIHEHYNWEKVTKPTASHLKKIFSTLELKV